MRRVAAAVIGVVVGFAATVVLATGLDVPGGLAGGTAAGLYCALVGGTGTPGCAIAGTMQAAGITNTSTLNQQGAISNTSSNACTNGVTGDVCVQDGFSVNGNISTQGSLSIGDTFGTSYDIDVRTAGVAQFGISGYGTGNGVAGFGYVQSSDTANLTPNVRGIYFGNWGSGVTGTGTFGLTKAKMSEITCWGADLSSCALGTSVAVPLYFGTNNLTRLTVAAAGQLTHAATATADNATLFTTGDGSEHMRVKGGGLVSLGTTAQAVAGVDAGSLDPTSTSIVVTCGGGGTCYYTMGETNATVGDVITVCSAAASTGQVKMIDIANVFVGPAAVNVTGLGPDDCFEAKYVDDANDHWVVTSVSDN